jgi:hypothetical protein
MSGGRYEEENLAVLLSFIKDDFVFLDIGANVGFFTLNMLSCISPWKMEN